MGWSIKSWRKWQKSWEGVTINIFRLAIYLYMDQEAL